MSLECVLSRNELKEFLEGWDLRLLSGNKFGGFNTVFFAEDILESHQTPMKHAVKVPNTEKKLGEVKSIQEGLKEHPFSEINKDVMVKQKRIRHPQVPVSDLYYYNKEGQSIPIVREDFAPGITLEELANLPTFINLDKKRKEYITMEVFRQSSEILSYFESNEIFHNDLKIDNIMIDFPGTDLNANNMGIDFHKNHEPWVYILDMNLSVDYGSEVNFENSCFFRPPERYSNPLNYDEALSDLFSLGLCIYYLWNRRVHLDISNKNDDLRRESVYIMSSKKRFYRSLSFRGMPKQLGKSLRKVLSYEPKKRV